MNSYLSVWCVCVYIYITLNMLERGNYAKAIQYSFFLSS